MEEKIMTIEELNKQKIYASQFKDVKFDIGPKPTKTFDENSMFPRMTKISEEEE